MRNFSELVANQAFFIKILNKKLLFNFLLTFVSDLIQKKTFKKILKFLKNTMYCSDFHYVKEKNHFSLCVKSRAPRVRHFPASGQLQDSVLSLFLPFEKHTTRNKIYTFTHPVVIYNSMNIHVIR